MTAAQSATVGPFTADSEKTLLKASNGTIMGTEVVHSEEERAEFLTKCYFFSFSISTTIAHFLQMHSNFSLSTLQIVFVSYFPAAATVNLQDCRTKSPIHRDWRFRIKASLMQTTGKVFCFIWKRNHSWRCSHLFHFSGVDYCFCFLGGIFGRRNWLCLKLISNAKLHKPI